MGLTPIKPSYDGATLHQDRDGEARHVPDPDPLTPEKREALINLLQIRLGYTH